MKRNGEMIASITMLIAWVAVSVIASQLIVGYLMLWILGKETLIQPVPTAIYSALSYIVAMILIIIVPPRLFPVYKKNKAKIAKCTRNEIGLRELPTWTDIGLSVAGFLAYLILAFALTYLFSMFPWFNAEEAQDVGFSIYINSFDRVVAFLTLVVVAPIAEEVIFRGWLYDKIRNKLLKQYSNKISIVISILLVSLLFALIHMQWNVGVNVFALSVVLCAMREITGTIYAGILTHMLKNGVAFFLIYVIGMR